MPDLYSGSAVTEFSGSSAVKKLSGSHDKAVFAVAYHPQCPHCTKMVSTYKDFAQMIKSSNAQMELIAINMSKSRQQAAALTVEYYPTIRLYKTDGSTVEFQNMPTKENFAAFVKENGVSI